MRRFPKSSSFFTSLAGLALMAGAAGCAEKADAPAAGAAKPYPLETCIVSDEKFGGDMGEPIVKVYDGQEIKFCCKMCVPKYEKDPAKYNAKLTDAAKKAPAPAAKH